MTSLRDYLSKSRRVQHPGTHGGKYYIDHNGEVVYGERPAVRVRGSARGTPVDIHIEGHTYEAEHLGKGHYAKAFRFGPDVFLFVKGDSMKEAIQGIDNPHVPRVEHVADHDDDTTIYKMPYYEPLKAKHEKAWHQYRALEKHLEQAKIDVSEDARNNKRVGRNLSLLSNEGYAVNDRLAELVRQDGNLPESLAQAIEDMSSNAANYGSGVTFELGTRNLGVNGNGDIVLRDVLFDAEKLEQERRAMRRQRGL